MIILILYHEMIQEMTNGNKPQNLAGLARSPSSGSVLVIFAEISLSPIDNIVRRYYDENR